MIPKLTKKEFVGIWNVSRRMTDQERALLWQAIYAAGINPPHKKSYGKILTQHEWNDIVRPALLALMDEYGDAGDYAIAIKVDHTNHEVTADLRNIIGLVGQERVLVTRALLKAADEMLK
jgi:hypothetical protein